MLDRYDVMAIIGIIVFSAGFSSCVDNFNKEVNKQILEDKTIAHSCKETTKEDKSCQKDK